MTKDVNQKNRTYVSIYCGLCGAIASRNLKTGVITGLVAYGGLIILEKLGEKIELENEEEKD